MRKLVFKGKIFYSVRRLTFSELKCYTTLIQRETQVPPSQAKSGKPINVVHMSSTFAPSLTTAIIFRCLGYHDCYRKRGLHLPMDEKKMELVEVQGCSQKRNARREYKCLQTTEQLILFILPRNEELPQKIQIKHTDTLN